MNNQVNQTNQVHLSGFLDSEPVVNHQSFGKDFYRATLRIPRLSGAEDILQLVMPETLYPKLMHKGQFIVVDGQIRTQNILEGERSRLQVTAFVKSISLDENKTSSNAVHLKGAICRPTTFRTTPFGRQITDLMLAVNRDYGKSDYIPCITWGKNAQTVAEMKVGDQLEVTGRFQSRIYTKTAEDGTVTEHTAYEVSLDNVLLLPTETQSKASNVPTKEDGEKQ